jgi:hypothetical protein
LAVKAAMVLRCLGDNDILPEHLLFSGVGSGDVEVPVLHEIE